MRGLSFVRRVPLAASGALRRFGQDPARGRAALERAVPGLGGTAPETPAALVDRAIARDRYADACDALAMVPVSSAERASCELAVDVLAGRLSQAARSHPHDARSRRAVRAARRQLAVLAQPIPAAPARAPGEPDRAGLAGPPGRTGRDGIGVLHVVTNSLPLTQAGSTIRTQRVARAQRDLGWDARVVTRLGYPVTHGDLRSPNPQMVDGVSYHRLLPLVMPADERLRTAYAAQLGRLVEDLRPDVLHAASDHVNAAVALDVGRAHGIPVAYEARTFFEDTWLARHGGEEAPDSDTYALLRDRHTEALLAADVVTTLGTGMRDAIVARGVDPERVFIAPNAVPMNFLEPRDQAGARTALGIGDALWVGSVATINDDEGLDTLIDSVALLRGEGRDVRVLIVGDGPGLADLRRRAERSGVPLLAPGRVPVAEVRQWYDVLDVFALPRRDTAVNRAVTALKPLEAQARGVPVVGSDLPAVAEVLAPGSPLVAPGDAAALAEALRSLADPATRGEAGERARAWVEATRTWPSVMEAYRAAYSFLGALTG
jgi:glycosyltransferase involved in cell wall biosynthesis